MKKTNAIPFKCASWARKFWLKYCHAESDGYIEVFGQSRLSNLGVAALFNLLDYRRGQKVEAEEYSPKALSMGLPIVFHGDTWERFTSLGLTRFDFERQLNLLAQQHMMSMLIASVEFFGAEQATAARHILEFYGISHDEYDYETMIQLYKEQRLDGNNIIRRTLMPPRKRRKPEEINQTKIG